MDGSVYIEGLNFVGATELKTKFTAKSIANDAKGIMAAIALCCLLSFAYCLITPQNAFAEEISMESASVASENEEDLPADTPSANSTGSVAGSGSTNDAIGSISVDDAAGSGSASNTTGSTPSEESSVENASSTSENTSENEAQKKNSTTDTSSVANTDTDAFSASNSTADAPSAANTATDALSTANTTAGVLSASNANTTSVAHSEDGPTITYYYSVADAMSAAENGKIIYMDCDWNLTSALVIPKNTEVNINMNCHSISNNGSSEVIHMEK